MTTHISGAQIAFAVHVCRRRIVDQRSLTLYVRVRARPTTVVFDVNNNISPSLTGTAVFDNFFPFCSSLRSTSEMTVITMPFAEKKNDNEPLVTNMEVDPSAAQVKPRAFCPRIIFAHLIRIFFRLVRMFECEVGNHGCKHSRVITYSFLPCSHEFFFFTSFACLPIHVARRATSCNRVYASSLYPPVTRFLSLPVRQPDSASRAPYVRHRAFVRPSSQKRYKNNNNC